MKVKYCCDERKKDYENYYMKQAGEGLPGFQGTKYQRGNGLGSILTGLFRVAAPLLKKGAISLGKQALKKGLSMASNYLEGGPRPSKKRKRTSSQRPARGINRQQKPFSTIRLAPVEQSRSDIFSRQANPYSASKRDIFS